MGGLHEALREWVAEGLIDHATAARIEAAEAMRVGPLPDHVVELGVAGADPKQDRRWPLVVEALGYLGGALAALAGFMAVQRLWPDIPTGAQLAFSAAGVVVLLVAGALVDPTRDPALGRLRSVLWLLSTGCLAAFAAVLGSDVLHLGEWSTTLLAAAAATSEAAVLWWLTPTPLQHVAMFTALSFLVGAGIARIDPDNTPQNVGLAIWLMSAVWAIAVQRGLIEPRTVGFVVASLGLLAGAQMTMVGAAGHILALATVAGLLAAGVVWRRVWLLGLGAIGVLQVVPQAGDRYLPATLAAPLALATIGAVLLGVSVTLSRKHRNG